MHPVLAAEVSKVQAMLKVINEGDQPHDVYKAFRKSVTRDSPLAFALVYLSTHIALDDGTITLSDIHVSWLDQALRWGKGPGRDIYIAPRGTGKSTWWLTIIPLWAAATERIAFAVAFSDSATQAETHLATFRNELERNTLLKIDYPDLVAPSKRTSGATLADNRGMLHTRAGFVYAARGIDSGALGLKVGDQRPDLIILDDIEPTESNYSAHLIAKRLNTVTDAVLPMGNEATRTILVGTTTLRGSIIHQAVMHETTPADWISDYEFNVHHSLPYAPNGESIWPERWPTAWLRKQEGQRGFAKNFLNQPVPETSAYWTPSDFRIAQLPTVSRRVLAIDPAVTTKRTSDQTGLAVVSFSSAARACQVDHCEGVRLKGAPLRTRVLQILRTFPDIAEIIWESNQGGDMMAESVLNNMPVPVRTVHSSEKKEIRAERLLAYYRRRQVTHTREFAELEGQMLEFPNGLHDDLPDAVATGVLNFTGAARSTTLQKGTR